MEKKVFVIIALLGGIIALIGVFLPWAGGISGWDFPGAGAIALVYGLMILLGALAVWATGALSSMIPVGSLLVLSLGAGVAQLTSVDYGVWVYILGAILGLIGTLGIISLKK